MPAVSRAQQVALYAKKGSAWVHRHHFDRIAGEHRRKRQLSPIDKELLKRRRT